MNDRLSLSPETTSLLAEITEWYRFTSGDTSVADKWFTGFERLLESLIQHPDRHPLAREADEIGIELREVHYGSGRRLTHRALFVIEGDVVEVLTIRHHAQQDLTREELSLD